MSAYTINEFLTLDHSATLKVFNTIYEKMSLDSLRSCLVRMAPPTFWKEEKPDTLMPNSCGGCGASFVDHGSLACSDDVCFYDQRNDTTEVIAHILHKVDAPQADDTVVNTAQPQAKPHAPRAPKEAERHWPAMRVRNFIKQMNKAKFTKPERMNHLEGLEYLAQRIKVTVDELLKIRPSTYLDRMGLDSYSKSSYKYE
jgi:hypothetical protein